MRRLGLLALTLLPLLCSCAGAKPEAKRQLILSLDPPRLEPGEIILVSARPEPMATMRWISGTVQVLGAPTMPFEPGVDGSWIFKTQIPIFSTIEPGSYLAKAWGDDQDGQRYEGSLLIQVK